MGKYKKVIIRGRFPGLNDYTTATRKHRMAGANMKAEETERCRLHFIGWQRFNHPIYLQFTWYEANTRRDPDNIVFAKKFILDGMVKAQVLEDDNQKWIVGFEDIIDVDKEDPRIEVEIVEVRGT